MTITCPRCEGCGYLAKSENAIPWSKVARSLYDVMERVSCNWCARSGRIVRLPVEGDLRIWVVRNPPAAPTMQLVASLEEAKSTLRQWIADDRKNVLVEANVFGCEVFEDGDWCEWENEDGDDLLDVMDDEEDAKP